LVNIFPLKEVGYGLKNLRNFVLIAAFIVFIEIPLTVQADSALPAPPDGSPRPVCPGPAGPGTTRCHAWIKPDASTSPVGLTPAKMKAAYGFSTDPTFGSGQTIAIVDAYDLPTAENDLNIFRA
jgi:hypothetical protein